MYRKRKHVVVSTLVFLLFAANAASEQGCIPLYGYLDRFPVQGAGGVPVTANITINFPRLAPSIIDYKIEPEVITNVTKITLTNPGSFSLPRGVMYNFHPSQPLQSGTTYTVTITYGQYEAPLGSGNSCLNSTTSWQFTTATDILLRYAGPEGKIDKFEAVQAVQDYSSGVITKQEAIDVMIAYFANTPLT